MTTPPRDSDAGFSTPIRFHPDYLAYFNKFVGGAKHGIESLDDAFLDWSPNLKRLKR